MLLVSHLFCCLVIFTCVLLSVPQLIALTCAHLLSFIIISSPCIHLAVRSLFLLGCFMFRHGSSRPPELFCLHLCQSLKVAFSFVLFFVLKSLPFSLFLLLTLWGHLSLSFIVWNMEFFHSSHTQVFRPHTMCLMYTAKTFLLFFFSFF